MFCRNCGTKIPEHAAFCPVCGQVIKSAEANGNSQQPGNDNQFAGYGQTSDYTGPKSAGSGKTKKTGKKKKKTLFPIIIVIAAIAAAAAVGVFFFLSNRKTEVNLNKYLQVEFTGENGSGTVNASFDLEKMVNDNRKAFAISDKERESLTEEISGVDSSAMDMLGDLADQMGLDSGEMTLSDEEIYQYYFGSMFDGGIVSAAFTPEEGLSNGDQVSMTWTIDQDKIDKVFSVKLTGSDSVYAVSGLTDTAEPTAEPTEEPTVEPTAEPTEEPTAEPTKEATPTTAPDVQDHGVYTVYQTDYVTLRKEPSTSAGDYGTLNEGAEVTVKEFGCDGFWKVEYNGTTGYVLPSYLKAGSGADEPEAESNLILPKSVGTVSLLGWPSEKADVLDSISGGTTLPCYDMVGDDYYLVKYNGSYGYVSADALNGSSSEQGTAQGELGTYEVTNTDYLTLRTGSSTGATEICRLSSGDQVTALDYDCGGFWKVSYNGTTGYLLPTYLKPVSVTTEMKSSKTMKTTDTLTLRDIPGTNGEEFAKVPTGATVNFYAVSENGFYLVDYNGQMGFLLAQYLTD